MYAFYRHRRDSGRDLSCATAHCFQITFGGMIGISTVFTAQ